jgi:hypothetical protein
MKRTNANIQSKQIEREDGRAVVPLGFVDVSWG